MKLYFLAGDGWRYYPWPPFSPYRTAYVNGRLGATVGYRSHPHPPEYPDHTTAMLAVVNGTYPMTALPSRPSLSVADVLDLRVSARAPSHDTGNHGEARFAIGYNGTADVYELRANPVSPVLASHRDINVIAALLRGERFEAGFIARVLDSGYAPDEIALDADARERARRTRVEADAQARARRRQDEDEARARRALTPVSDLPADATLDDLFRTL